MNNKYEKTSTEELVFNSELLSKTIDWLRFPLAVLVILIHVYPQTNPLFIPIHEININNINVLALYSIIGRLGHYFSQIAVPFFFFTSGYYFFKGNVFTFSIYKRKMTNKFKTLVLPYILWNTIAICLSLPSLYNRIDVHYLLSCFWNVISWSNQSIFQFSINHTISAPIVFPLWFLRDLIVLNLLSPLIYLGIKKFGVIFIYILSAAYIFNICSLPGIGVTGIFFFSFGAYLRLKGIDVIMQCYKLKSMAMAISLIMLFVTLIQDGNPITSISINIYCIFGLISAINLVSKAISINRIKVHSNLSKMSFFIYSIHTIIFVKLSILTFSKIISEKIFMSNIYHIGLICSYFTSPIICTCICIVIFNTLKKVSPKFLSVLTGNRI